MRVFETLTKLILYAVGLAIELASFLVFLYASIFTVFCVTRPGTYFKDPFLSMPYAIWGAIGGAVVYLFFAFVNKSFYVSFIKQVSFSSLKLFFICLIARWQYVIFWWVMYTFFVYIVFGVNPYGA